MNDSLTGTKGPSAPRFDSLPTGGNRILAAAAFAALGLLVTTVGCQSWFGLQAPRCAVSGTVTWQGAAVANSWVVFIPLFPEPVDNHMYPIAYGCTDDRGRFQLRMSEESLGAVPGTYQVVIQNRPQPAGSGNAEGQGSGPPARTIPAEFNRHSRLRAIVPNQPAAVIDFAL